MFVLSQCCTYALVGFWHKNHLVRARTSFLGLKYLIWSPHTKLSKLLCFISTGTAGNVLVKSTGFCHHKHSSVFPEDSSELTFLFSTKTAGDVMKSVLPSQKKEWRCSKVCLQTLVPVSTNSAEYHLKSH